MSQEIHDIEQPVPHPHHIKKIWSLNFQFSTQQDKSDFEVHDLRAMILPYQTILILVIIVVTNLKIVL